jgi:methylenetetrahydrofolate dehydrogenase (NADP+)/methenyltetrahydrofolate cyclohydrolase
MGEAYDGIMVQLPLPPHIDARRVAVEAIDPAKDVDGFLEWSKFQPCTPLGIMKYLEYCGFPIEGSDVVVIGRSDIVGKPMAKMLTDANATVTLCHSKTKDLESKLSRADLIICAVGKPGFIKASDWNEVPIIDVGINFVDGKLVGDVDSSLEDTNVTPVPGGVGLLTRCALLENVINTIEE